MSERGATSGRDALRSRDRKGDEAELRSEPDETAEIVPEQVSRVAQRATPSRPSKPGTRSVSKPSLVFKWSPMGGLSESHKRRHLGGA
jgi:hypothetical protein